MDISVSDIAKVTGGEYIGDETALRRIVSGLTWDSRTIMPDNIFLAMPGMRVDGNDYVRAAIQRGAGAVVCTRMPTENVIAVAGEFACPMIVVDDGVEALEKIAGSWRDRLHVIVIGVTGSTGKTSTKDLLSSVFSQRFKTTATQGNQNNEIGVPATILAADEDTEVLIVELGMRGMHQIEHLCTFVKPSIAVVTNVGVSHMELLGSRENIAHAKSELLSALPDTGYAVLNADDEYTPLLESFAHLAERGVTVHSYGFSPEAETHAQNVSYDAEACASFEIVTGDATPVPVTLGMPGRHNVLNALAAYATGINMGIAPDDIARGLAEAKASGMRMEIEHTPDGVTILNDAYNANPDSMRASISTLMTLEGDGRRIAVLGDMGELGSDEYQLHVDVGTFAAQADLDMLVCIGTLSVGIKAGALAADMDAARVKSFTGVDEAIAFLEKNVQEGDLVLVKASRFMELERIVKGIMQR